jgi:DNA-binding CsgD family transcriptional regulator
VPADRREESDRGLLTEFGLSEQAEAVWLALLETPDASIEAIGRSTCLSTGEVRASFAELLATGLARPESSCSGFGVHEPSIAIETLIARAERELASRRERLGEIRANVPELAELYTRARAGDQHAADLDVVSARDEVQQRIFLAGEATHSQHRHLMRDVRADTIRGSVASDAASLARGVQQRSIIGTADLADPEVFTALESLHDLGEEIRALPNVPTQMMIMDRDLAVVPRSAKDSTHGAIFIREQALVDLLISLFDHMWSIALPVFADATGVGAPSGRTARVLELMATGIKDERIARTLGIGSRTVRRDIADLKEGLGVSSRTEIVAAAVRQGWLE